MATNGAQREDRGKSHYLSHRGFTLIELMIVIAIIAIIAAIAIPNLMQSRLRANEATAVTCVRNYGTAQVTFQLGGHAAVTTNATPGYSGLRGYTDNFRNLFYGNPRTVPIAGSGGLYSADTSRNLALISQAMADAFIKGLPFNTNSTPLIPPDDEVTYQGYHFAEDPYLASHGTLFAHTYALIAVPAHSANSGNNVFWMDSENSVMRMGLPASFTTPQQSYDHIESADLTPLQDATARANWSAL